MIRLIEKNNSDVSVLDLFTDDSPLRYWADSLGGENGEIELNIDNVIALLLDTHEVLTNYFEAEPQAYFCPDGDIEWLNDRRRLELSKLHMLAKELLKEIDFRSTTLLLQYSPDELWFSCNADGQG